MIRRIHVVPHFHWDREWYFTAEESKILLVEDMEDILIMLETNPAYPCFVLDGQTAVLEDYFSVKPENFQRVKKLAESGKLIIGPWYTQTDEMVVGGESIVRNLLYGKMDCEKIGPCMEIGYLPDSFGQSAALPQILNGFGIQHCIFWRGTSERMGTDKTEFLWEGDGNSRVLVQLLPLGYAIGKYLPIEEGELQERLDKYFPVLERGTTTGTVLLPNGHDQMPIQKNIFEVMEQIRRCYSKQEVTFGRYEDVLRNPEKATGLVSIQGEFLDGKYMRVHRSIYSSRSDLKASNTRIENKITNCLEPLMSIAYKLGFPYEHGLVEAIWKEMLKNHAHDSIGCCCSDRVHRAISDRFFLAEERTDHLIAYYQRKIADAMTDDISVEKLIVFNLLPYERTESFTGEMITRLPAFTLTDENGKEVPFEIVESELVDAGLIDRQIVHYGNYDPFRSYQLSFFDTIPAMGYKTYFITKAASKHEEVKKENSAEHKLENIYYKIEIEKNGTLTLTDKETGISYSQVLLLEDSGDDGDGYDYSPPAEDFICTSEDETAEITVWNYQYDAKAEITVKMKVPKDLDYRRQKKKDAIVTVKWKLRLRKDSRLLEIEAEVDNQAKDHRVRLLVPNQSSISYSVSDIQFGRIRRMAVDPALKVWEEENWSERPDAIYPFLSYVHADTETGIAVLTNSVREYEITGKNLDTLAVTLFRSVGVLGKENLLRRPGRPSGIKLETPDSQMLGRQIYHLALTTDLKQVPRLAKEYTTPIVTYNQKSFHAMKLNRPAVTVPYQFSLLKMENQKVMISTLKKAEKENVLLLRCYNPGIQKETLSITCENKCMQEIRMDETQILEQTARKDISLEPNEVKTCRLIDESEYF